MDDWTDELLQSLREGLLQYYKEMNMSTPRSITCDECAERRTCVVVYDLYNVNGDCLMK